jgi:hypothetical protein
VARLTGLSTQLIRAWEQRYGAVVAERAENGRRIYTTADVEKLGLLKVLTERGIAISTIATLDTDALRARVGEADAVALRPLEGNVRVAALGSFVPEMLRREVIDSNPVELVLSGADPDRFLADVKNLRPDVLVLEVANLAPDSPALLERYREASGAGETIVAYGFGRSEDERTLAGKGFRLLRTPMMADELAVCILAAAVKLRAGDHYAPPPEPERKQDQREAVAPPRRFSQEQLVRLAGIASSVDCECPNHMAEVVQTLSAFESYSAGCEDRNEQDAALHAYLHRTTAQARALMEEALAHLVEVEKLSV